MAVSSRWLGRAWHAHRPGGQHCDRSGRQAHSRSRSSGWHAHGWPRLEPTGRVQGTRPVVGGSGSRRDHHRKIITAVGKRGSHHEGRSRPVPECRRIEPTTGQAGQALPCSATSASGCARGWSSWPTRASPARTSSSWSPVMARLLRPDRADEPHRHGSLGRWRQWIESTFDTLKDQLGLERHGGRTLAGVYVRVAQRLLAWPPGSGGTGRPASPISAPGRLRPLSPPPIGSNL